jgi:hypothetical protein
VTIGNTGFFCHDTGRGMRSVMIDKQELFRFKTEGSRFSYEHVPYLIRYARFSRQDPEIRSVGSAYERILILLMSSSK